LVQQGKHEQAKELQLALASTSKCIVSENGIAGVKYAMDLRGYNGGVPRLPLLPLPEEKKQQIAALLTQYETSDARV